MPPKGYRKMRDNPNPQTPRPPVNPAMLQPKPRRKWEYTTLSAERPLNGAQFDVYGADGWELISVYVRMDAVHAVFKREVL